MQMMLHFVSLQPLLSKGRNAPATAHCTVPDAIDEGRRKQQNPEHGSGRNIRQIQVHASCHGAAWLLLRWRTRQVGGACSLQAKQQRKK
jgi:hypothetical protein